MRAKAGTEVGAYRLVSRIGRGAVGQVWRAVAAGCPEPVAIKLVSRDADERATWLTEVRAAARLNHPSLQPVLDTGVAEHVDGYTGPVAYMVGELAAGTLQHERNELGWPQIRTFLAQILDGLSHAHARGVTHRDLKPGNVLYRDLPGGRLWRLTDFGVADLGRSPDAEDTTSLGSTGTPLYMSPEQARGDWRHQGPWTDLYGVGCIVHELVGWGHPFADLAPLEVVARQLRAALPPLDPSFDVPDGLGAWVERCTARQPRDRFQRASEALEALLALEPEVEPPAPIPPPPPPWIPAAGLGLLGVRPPPLVGRTDERAALVEVAERHGTVVLRGPAGVGKSRLARWLCEVRHEAGASVLWASFSPDPGPHDGLPALIERDLRTQGLASWELLSQVGGRVDDPAEIAALLRPDEPGDVVLGTAMERLLVVKRFLAGEAARRPVVLWLDDVQWDDAPLRLVPLLEGLPVTIVLTARDEALVDRPYEAGLLEALQADRIDVGPLSAVAARELVLGLLPLEPGLSARVEEAAQGHPLFAQQLVQGWADASALVAGPDGFKLAPDVGVALPSEATELWRQRIEATAPGPGALALELGALLGMRVDGIEWREACRVAGATDLETGLERLVGRGLATRQRDGGFVWAHRLLHHAAVERVASTEHHARLAAACAEAVEERAEPARVGRLRLVAGDLEGGVTLLLRASIRASQSSRSRHARALLDEREAALAHLDPDHRLRLEGDVVRIRHTGSQGDAVGALALAERTVVGARASGADDVLADALCARAVLHRRGGRLDAADADALEAEGLFEKLDNAVGIARALGLRADQVEGSERMPLVERAIAVLEARPETTGTPLHAHMVLRLANAANIDRDLPRSRELYTQALAMFERHGHRGYQAQMLAALGSLAAMDGDLQTGLELNQRALDLLAGTDQPVALAVVRGNQALLTYEAGDLARAEVLGRLVVTEHQRVGLLNRTAPQMLLIATLARQGRLAEARAIRDRVRRDSERRELLHAGELLLATDLLLVEDVAAWDEQLPAVVELARSIHSRHPVWLIVQAAAIRAQTELRRPADAERLRAAGTPGDGGSGT